ncbi:MAG: SPASM domain-containing protein [Candidatus Thorarchaeota archaeon]
MQTLLTEEETALRCGSGIDTFAIHVDGSIGICPISPDWDFSIIGHINESSPASIRNSMTVDEPCPSCDIFGICGGRCLFANKQRLWGEAGFKKVCGTVRHLIDALQSKLGRVKELVKVGILTLTDFDYPEFNNGCEIIP